MMSMIFEYLRIISPQEGDIKIVSTKENDPNVMLWSQNLVTTYHESHPIRACDELDCSPPLSTKGRASSWWSLRDNLYFSAIIASIDS